MTSRRARRALALLRTHPPLRRPPAGRGHAACRQSLMRPQMIADILSAALVANVHFVTASGAPRDAVQQKFAVSRCSSCLRAHVFGSVVSDNTSDLFIGRPIDVSWISILHDEPPFLHWPRGFCRRQALAHNLAHPGSAIDECAGIGGFFRIAATAETVARAQHGSPCWSRRGRSRPRSFNTRMTLATVRTFRKVWNTSPIRSCTAKSGSLMTIPLGSRTSPIGRPSASSPRSAFAKRPVVRRLRIV